MPKLYRKKPVFVEAVQHTGGNLGEIETFMTNGGRLITEYDGKVIVIETSKGTMRADVGDYIVKGVKGEFYPCKPDIFKMTYEAVK